MPVLLPMSAGHPHHRPVMRHPAELKRLEAEGGFAELMNRWQRLDVDHDIHDLAGYDVAGTVRYLDRDFFRGLLDPAHAEAIGIGAIDTGLTPEQTVDCLMEHEGVEKVLLDADNPLNSYQAAHEMATAAEHQKVRSFGGTPLRYERGLAAAIAYCERKALNKPPLELACAPLLDDPDRADLKALKTLQQLGVTDAFKTAKHAVGYGKSTGTDQCRGCQHWQGDNRAQDLSPCDVVDGLVRGDRWCRQFEKETTDGQQGSSRLQGGQS